MAKEGENSLLWSYAQTLWQNEAARLDFIGYAMCVMAIPTFISLQFVHAKYGRYSPSTATVVIPSRLAWFVQELPAFAVPVLLLVFTDCPRSGQWQNQVALGMFLVHYFQRTFVYSLLIRGGKPTPLVNFLLATVFCTINGYLQGGHLLKSSDLSSVSNVLLIGGVLTFLAGMAINIHSDHIMRNLRKKGEKGYKIPYGGLFEYVSGANFFGECLEWAGYAIACGTVPAFAFAIFTVSNTGPRACHHHRWYKEKFEDYPKDRKALVPFVF